MRRATTLVTGAALATLLLTACSADTSDTSTPSTPSTPSATSAAPSAPPTQAGEFNWDAVTLTTGPNPSMAVKPGTPPVTTLTVRTVDSPGAGTDQVADPGDIVTVRYLGVGLQSGQVFDENFSADQPATFPLSGVIAGWTQGLQGAKVGERRMLAIPADLAYGQTPPPGSAIKPGESLLFLVDIVAVEHPAGYAPAEPTVAPSASSAAPEETPQGTEEY